MFNNRFFVYYICIKKMFTSRRKRQTANTFTYNTQETIKQRQLWKETVNHNIYNTSGSRIGIGNSTPGCVLDVSGCINTDEKYTINYISIAPPVGSIMAYTMAVSPDGWLVCDGSLVNKIVYGALFGVIGFTFGGSDLSFNIPNYCGAFLRGIGSHNGYSGPVDISSVQLHATQTHAHLASSVVTEAAHTHTQESHSHSATTSITDPGHVHSQHTTNDDYNNTGGNSYPNQNNPSFAGWDSAGTKTWTNIDSSTTGITAGTSIDSTTPSINSATTGITVATTVANSTTSVNATETRPYNYGVYWIIKY
jgi:microcystin-dependent protein